MLTNHIRRSPTRETMLSVPSIKPGFVEACSHVVFSRKRRCLTRLWLCLTTKNSLRFIWVLIVWTREANQGRILASRCKWPAELPHGSNNDSTHVLLVADPQVLDLNSYPNRPRWLQILTQYVVDMNLRKGWNAVISTLKPDVVIFLGDMMDNGRSVDDHEFSAYYRRFKSIFKLTRSIPVHYIPGNHDVGLGPSSSELIKAHARSRYLNTFGPFNQDFRMANHTFLLIDAPSLVDEFANAAKHGLEWSQMQGGTAEYLQAFYETRPSDPIILFSHIPLARSNFTAGSCGPLREKNRLILPGIGKGYRNLLPNEVTLYLLNDIRPSIIFSGDDHDYCDYRHVLLDQSEVHEISVRSFSMAMGIKRPGFQLLSVAPPPLYSQSSLSPPLSPPTNFAHEPCLLPNQTNIYGLSALFTLIYLFIMNFRSRQRRKPQILPEAAEEDEGRNLFPRILLGSLKQRYGSGAEEDPLNRRSFENERPHWQPTLLPVHSTNSVPIHSYYQPSPVQKTRRKKRQWYTQGLCDIVYIGWPALVFYVFISYWYFL